jgi:hypothetical protein
MRVSARTSTCGRASVVFAVVSLCWIADGCASRTAGDRGVTCGAKKVRLDKARKISLDMTLGQIESLLGPPERDVGSGVFVLEWSCTDGTRIHVSAAPDTPTTKPIAVTFSSGK